MTAHAGRPVRRPTEGRSLLILSFLDYTREPNGRIHHLVRHAPAYWDRVTVFHGSHPAAGPLLPAIGRSLRYGVVVRESGRLREIEVHPLLNTPESLAKRTMRYPGTLPGRYRRLRRGAEGLLSSLGVVRDTAQMLSFAWALGAAGLARHDACVVQCPMSGQVGRWARRGGRVGTLLYDDIDYAPGWCDHRLRRAWVAWLEARALRAADRIVSVGSLLAARRGEAMGRPIAILPNGVDLERFRAGRRKVPHPPTLIYTGRVTDWTGLEVALEAVARVRRAIPDFRFLVVGRSDPPYERQLRAAAERLGLESCVEWIGEVPYTELPGWLGRSDVGFAAFRPTLMKQYAFPLKVIEYMAAGLPVLGTRGTETEAILQAHACGEAVAFDAAAMAEALRSIFDDAARRRVLSERAAAASERYDWGRLMREFHQGLLEQVATTAGRDA